MQSRLQEKEELLNSNLQQKEQLEKML